MVNTYSFNVSSTTSDQFCLAMLNDVILCFYFYVKATYTGDTNNMLLRMVLENALCHMSMLLEE